MSKKNQVKCLMLMLSLFICNYYLISNENFNIESWIWRRKRRRMKRTIKRVLKKRVELQNSSLQLQHSFWRLEFWSTHFSFLSLLALSLSELMVSECLVSLALFFKTLSITLFILLLFLLHIQLSILKNSFDILTNFSIIRKTQWTFSLIKKDKPGRMLIRESDLKMSFAVAHRQIWIEDITGTKFKFDQF